MGFLFCLTLRYTVVYVEWLWMQRERESSTPEEGDDMVGGSEQNVLEEAAGSVSAKECALKQVLC